MRPRKRILLALAVIAFAAASFVAGALIFRHRGEEAAQAGGGRKILYYRSPMNPQETSPTPKKDPMGMDYVPVYAGEAGTGGAGAPPGPPLGAGPNAVRIDPRVVQETGVTTERAEVRRLSRNVRTVGIVRPDERRLVTVTVKVTGWVERLYVNFTGEQVRQGDPLADIYSPELLATQREYLVALQYARSLGRGAPAETRAGAWSLVQGAKRRLLLWGVLERDVIELARRGVPRRLMTIRASADGVVLDKQVTAGMQIQPGMTLLRVGDLREVWLFAQIYPHQLPWLREGQVVEIQVAGIPDRLIEGRVDYIQPVVSMESRTVEVRVQVAQPGDDVLLKPNMYANVTIRSPVAQQATTVNEQAVIRTGERTVVIVALGNGYFEPREVKLGASGGGYVEILDGLKPNELVVTSSEFLLDSESNLRSAMGAMGGHAGHGAAPAIGGSGAAKPSQSQGVDAGPPSDGGHGGH